VVKKPKLTKKRKRKFSNSHNSRIRRNHPRRPIAALYVSPTWVLISVRARGLGGCNPQTRAKPLFFGKRLNFSDRSQKWKKLYLLNEKNGIHFILP